MKTNRKKRWKHSLKLATYELCIVYERNGGDIGSDTGGWWGLWTTFLKLGSLFAGFCPRSLIVTMVRQFSRAFLNKQAESKDTLYQSVGVPRETHWAVLISRVLMIKKGRVEDLTLICPGMHAPLCSGHLVYSIILAVTPSYQQLTPEILRLVCLLNFGT
jgi:hypothetical protein